MRSKSSSEEWFTLRLRCMLRVESAVGKAKSTSWPPPSCNCRWRSLSQLLMVPSIRRSNPLMVFLSRFCIFISPLLSFFRQFAQQVCLPYFDVLIVQFQNAVPLIGFQQFDVTFGRYPRKFAKVFATEQAENILSGKFCTA